MADPTSGKAPVYIKPGTRKNPDIKDDKTLYWHDRRDVKKAERDTLALGNIPKEETLKEQREREEREWKEGQKERLIKSSVDKTLAEDDLDLVRISKYFGIDPTKFGDYKDKLNLLWEWGAKEADSRDYVNVLTRLRKLEKIVDIGLEENRIDALYRWIRLDLDQKRIEQEKELYEK